MKGIARGARGAVAVAMLVTLPPVLAAEDPDAPCQQGSAMAAFMCQGPVWKAAELQLQVTYERVMTSLRRDGSVLADDLRDAQRLWIRQRELDCSLYARNRVEGSPWTGFWESECHAEQARIRTAWLQSLEY